MIHCVRPNGRSVFSHFSHTASVLLAIVLLSVASSPSGAVIPQGNIVVELETVASGLVSPLGVTHVNDGSGRLFIWEQTGQIRIVDGGGVLLPTPFLDISASMVGLNSFFDERGLLGLAFHPNYASNGRFFVRYSAPRAGDPAEPCNDPAGFIVGCHSEVLAEFQVSAADPNVADPSSEIILFSVDEPQFNHNSGEVAFGPDGFLYFTLGDGGGANDGLADLPPSHGPNGNGQNVDTALGSMIRIDVDSTPAPGLPYAIPPGNPFASGPGLDEIYAYGFRNAYKFSFDNGPGGTGDLYVADVGQDLIEELNIVTNGGNYGWVTREGFNCFDPLNPGTPPANCPTTGPLGEPLLDPIVEYTHVEGGLSIVGGFVYRGLMNPTITGTYVFGDFSGDFFIPSGRLYYLADAAGSPEIRELQLGVPNAPYGLYLKGFGEDQMGEIYVCGSSELAPTGSGGVVQRLRVLDVVPVVSAQLAARSTADGVSLEWNVANAIGGVDEIAILRGVDGGTNQVIANWSNPNSIDDWTDVDTQFGREYHYRLVAQVGDLEIRSEEIVVARAPGRTLSHLVSNVPNPFNPATQLRFQLVSTQGASLRIFDAAGRLVRTFDLSDQPAGAGSVVWNGTDERGHGVASGVYTVRLVATDASDIQRIALIR